MTQPKQVMNPYVYSKAIQEPELFFGRTRELNELLSKLRTMQSVSVVGERRIGKTSLLYRLMKSQNGSPVDNEKHRFCMVDFQVVRSEQDFYQLVIKNLTQTDPISSLLEREPSQEPKEWLRIKFVDSVRRGPVRTVLCLDEFEGTMDRQRFSPDFFLTLRGLAGKGDMAIITATRHPLSEIAGDDDLTSPLFNIFSVLRLGELQPEEAQTLVNQPAELAQRPWTTEEQAFLLEQGKNHPYRLNAVCFHTFQLKLESGGQLSTDWKKTVEARFADDVRVLQAKGTVQEQTNATTSVKNIFFNGSEIPNVPQVPNPVSSDQLIIALVLAVVAVIIAGLSAQTGSQVGLTLAGISMFAAVAMFVSDFLNRQRSKGG
jgi:uncharacterized protein